MVDSASKALRLERLTPMPSRPGHTALDNIDEALALLDRVSRFLSVGGFKSEDPLQQIERASECLARARDELDAAGSADRRG